MWEISQHHKIHKRFKKLLYYISTLDLTFNILTTWQEIQHSVHLNTKKTVSGINTFCGIREGGINTSCWRELLVHVMNISACTGRKKEQVESEWWSIQTTFPGRLSFLVFAANWKNRTTMNIILKMKQLNFYTGSVLIFPVWPGSAAHTYFRDCISCFEIFIFSSFNKELQFVFNLPHT